MSSNIRTLPQRRDSADTSEEAARRAVEAIRLLIRQELAIIEQERAEPPDINKDELTVKEVAKLKCVEPRTIYDWVRTDKIKYHRTPGGQLRFYRRDVEE